MGVRLSGKGDFFFADASFSTALGFSILVSFEPDFSLPFESLLLIHCLLLVFAATCSRVLFEVTDLSSLVMSVVAAYWSFFLINSQAFSPLPLVFTKANSPFNFF